MNSEVTKKNHSKFANGNRPSIALPSVFGNKKQTHNSRRSAVLNKIFMKHITDLMATGEVAPSLIGRGIEVTHVSIAPDFTAINVYWIAQNNKNANEETEKVLRIAGGHLQHELTQLRVIGKVPPIYFVKNKQYNLLREVEDRLATVDFGEDFEPTAHIMRTNNTPILRTTVSEKIKKQLEKMEKESNNKDIDNIENKEEVEEDEDAYEIQVPEMRQNIMGFDHEYVLTKVKLSIGKIRAAEEKRKLGLPEFPQGSEESSEVSSFLSTSTKDEPDIETFIKKRIADEKRKKKATPYHEAKLEEEALWHAKLGNSDINDLHVEDECEDDYPKNL